MPNSRIALVSTLAISVFGVTACTGKPEAEPAKAAKTQSDAAKKAEPKKAAKAAGTSRKNKAETKQAETKKAAPKGKPGPQPRRANPGMTPEQIKEHAVASGDPEGGDFTLAEAFAGDEALADKAQGTLTAVFETTMGKFECELYEDKTPNTVANFVGLARGTRSWYDEKKREWVKGPFYDGVLFHRVIPGFMIQTGDRRGNGTGGPGYVIVDEFDGDLKHAGKGMLSMANRGPNTGSSQFFVTVAPTQHLDNRHAIFGKCGDASVPVEISKVPKDARKNKPNEDVSIKTIAIVRKKKA